ncbi:hypothetical protein EBU95_12930, partial [bacterium]|nr:hypothetical protein [bacterium]
PGPAAAPGQSGSLSGRGSSRPRATRAGHTGPPLSAIFLHGSSPASGLVFGLGGTTKGDGANQFRRRPDRRGGMVSALGRLCQKNRKKGDALGGNHPASFRHSRGAI